MTTILVLLSLIWAAIVTAFFFVLSIIIIVANFVAVLFASIYHIIQQLFN